MKRVDYMIVGFGIAGAALALQLRKRGRSVVVFDEPHEHQASRVAAGLFNPITGKLMLRTWNADKLFPYLHDFYREAEKITGSHFFFPTPICIPFATIEEQNNWMVKGPEEFIEEVYTSTRYGDFINDRFGSVVLKGGGYVDTVKFLDAAKELFVNERSFKYDQLSVSDDEIIYDSYRANAIIFCEGTRVSANPFFSWVPIKPLKGETLQIRLDKAPPCIFNRGVYVVPAGENTWRVGATYSHDVTEGTTEDGKKELMERLSNLLVPALVPGGPDFVGIRHHSWGIRPTTPDRRPLLGSHPEYKNVLIFNGMGTKGVSLAPWSSGILCDYLEGGFQIKDDVNISRFYALYSKFRD